MGHQNRNRANRRVDGNPAPSEVRAARVKAKQTVEQAAATVYATPTVWTEWEADESERRRMHPAFYELYLIKTGQKSIDDILDAQAAIKAQGPRAGVIGECPECWGISRHEPNCSKR